MRQLLRLPLPSSSILFTGSFKVNGTTYVKHVMVPAVDPSQRSS